MSQENSVDIFEKATREGLLISTQKGRIDVYDIWKISLKELNSLAKSLRKVLKSEDEEDYLEEKVIVDPTLQLSFDIVLHVLKTKKAERDAQALSREHKTEKDKLLRILASRQEDDLNKLTTEQIQKRVNEIS